MPMPFQFQFQFNSSNSFKKENICRMSSRRKAAPIRRLPIGNTASSPVDQREENCTASGGCHSPIAELHLCLEQASTSGQVEQPERCKSTGHNNTKGDMDCAALLAKMKADMMANGRRDGQQQMNGHGQAKDGNLTPNQVNIYFNGWNNCRGFER